VTAVLIGVMLAGFFAVVRRMQRVTMRNVGMMGGRFMIAAFVVRRGLAVMFRCRFVVASSMVVVFSAFVSHGYVSFGNQPRYEKRRVMRILAPVCDMVVNRQLFQF
jgi:hypothetical protein